MFAETASFGGATLARLVAPAAAAVTVIAWRRGGARAAPLDFWLTASVTAYAGWAVASGMWTLSPSRTAELLGSLAIALAFAAAIAVLVRSHAELVALMAALVLGAGVTGVVVGVSYLADPIGRSGAGIGDPNFAAAYMLLSLPAALALASSARTPGRRALFGASAALAAVGVLATLSRGGLIALAVVAVLVVLAPSRLFFRSPRAKAVALLVAALAAVALSVAGATGASRLGSLSGIGTGSGRLNEWRAARASIAERPLLGLGFGAFVPASNELMRRTPGVSFRDFELRPRGSEAHNTYLGTAAELGWPGLACLVGVVASLLALLRRTARRARAVGDRTVERAAAAFAVGIAGWLVTAVFLSMETSRPFWLVAGVALALPTVLVRHGGARLG